VGLASVALCTTLFVLATLVGATAHRPGFFVIGWGFLYPVLTAGGMSGPVVAVGVCVVAFGLLFALVTGGYSVAPWWGQCLMFGLVIAGTVAAIVLAFAAVVTGLNLAIWVALCVLVAVMGVLLVFALFAALANN
jgi:hypothetical protein